MKRLEAKFGMWKMNPSRMRSSVMSPPTLGRFDQKVGVKLNCQNQPLSGRSFG